MDETIPRKEVLEVLAAVGGPDAAVNWILSTLGVSEPPPILDKLAEALREGRTITAMLVIGPPPSDPAAPDDTTRIRIA